MQCLVVADTHGYDVLLTHCLAKYLPADIDLVIHLGDNYADLDVISQAGFHCMGVPGTWCPAYGDVLIDNRRIEVFEGWRCLLTHTPTCDRRDLAADIDPQRCCDQGEVDFMFHGHTHQPNIYESGSVICVNPGHLKAPHDRGFQASFAKVTFEASMVDIVIYSQFNQQVIDRRQIVK